MLPLVLIIISLVIVLMSSNIHHYHNNLAITKNQIDQVTMETLIQIAREKLKRKLLENEQLDKETFTLPQGEVNVRITQLDEHSYQLLFTVTLDEQSKFQQIGFMNINKEAEIISHN